MTIGEQVSSKYSNDKLPKIPGYFSHRPKNPGDIGPLMNPVKEPRPIYVIADPFGQGTRGYIDPNTRLPYPSSQPYARNLADEMERRLDRPPRSQSMDVRFSVTERRFFDDFLAFNKPDTSPNNRLNSNPVRKLLRDAP